MEVTEPFFARRLQTVEDAHGGQKLGKGELTIWYLRGIQADLFAFAREIRRRAVALPFDLIIVDPIYKALGNRDENKAGNIGQLMSELERLITETGAAVAFVAHFSKGNQAAKESVDRIGGLGVFARDPDTILTMTKHIEDKAFCVDATLRNLPPIDPFVIRFNYPRFYVADDLKAADIKQARPGRPKKHTDPARILDVLTNKRITTAKWKDSVDAKYGIGKTQFYEFKKQLIAEGKLNELSDQKWSKKCIVTKESDKSDKSVSEPASP